MILSGIILCIVAQNREKVNKNGLALAPQEQKTTADTQKKGEQALFFIRILVVWVTGLEPATSTSQKSRATNCATPRRYNNYTTFFKKSTTLMIKL